MATDPFPEGADRRFQTAAARHSWMSALRDVGFCTASISTFAERHSAYHFDAGFNECLQPRYPRAGDGRPGGGRGPRLADPQRTSGTIGSSTSTSGIRTPPTGHRPPSTTGSPGIPAPRWLTEEVRAEHWGLPGPHSAQEVAGFGPRAVWDGWPRQPQQIGDMDAVRRMFDGYDSGVRYADHHLGTVVDTLARIGVLDETAIMVSSDHGENLGELGIYCDHQTADACTTHLPLVLRWPGLAVSASVAAGLHYQIDVDGHRARICSGPPCPTGGTAARFAAELSGPGSGRDHLVLSHAAWTAQRSVRFDRWLCIRTYFDAYHGYPAGAALRPRRRPPRTARRRRRASRRRDPGPRPPRRVGDGGAASVDDRRRPALAGARRRRPVACPGEPDWYLRRLRATGRGNWADVFEKTAPRPTASLDPAFLNPSIPDDS